MKKHLFVSELWYDRVYRIGEVAEFDDAIGNQLISLGVAQLVVVPEYLSTFVDMQTDVKPDEPIPDQAPSEIAIAETQEAATDAKKTKSKGTDS